MTPLTPLFPRKPWGERVEDWLNARSGEATWPFQDANRDSIVRSLTHDEGGLRVVVNIPADALLSFLAEGRYRNAYELPVVAGKPRTVSATRKHVDRLIGLDEPENYYFGAASMGGTGIRFYGEYCMALQSIDGATQVLDRNSYDLVAPPLAGDPDINAIVESIKGGWGRDVVDMLVLKVIPALESSTRLVTLGTVADAILHDEDFLEVHKHGNFTPDDVEEVRETPEDQAIQTSILEQFDAGDIPTMPEMLWFARRAKVRRVLRNSGLRTRIVASAGRGSRWK